MKQLTCEMCGSVDLIKQDDVFVCQFCGTKYSVEEAKKMMVEGTVKIDDSDELKNLYQLARRAKDEENDENAAKYYDMIVTKDPNSWEAAFFSVYYKSRRCKIAEISSAANSVCNCGKTVLIMIKDNVLDNNERKAAYSEVAEKIENIISMLFVAAVRHISGINLSLEDSFLPGFIAMASSCIYGILGVSDKIDELFSSDAEANRISVKLWKKGLDFFGWRVCSCYVRMHMKMTKGSSLVSFSEYSDFELSYEKKIRKYEPEFILQSQKSEQHSGCYVATAVYGSYDCPQVWTLRRYRDYTLAETWYGRAFIRTYYAVSPTLVKWFGHTKWFKKIWKGKLDRMVAKLQSKGVESTPYEDRNW